METKDIVLTRLLPKTGQYYQISEGDDGNYQAGWWKGACFDDNRVRFVSKTIAGDGVVIDLATGLMWAADGNKAGCKNGLTANWSTCLTYANGLTFAGFSDWRLPNVNELSSLVNIGVNSPSIYTAFFPNTKSSEYWSSSYYRGAEYFQWYVKFDYGNVNGVVESSLFYMRCVRGGVQGYASKIAKF